MMPNHSLKKRNLSSVLLPLLLQFTLDHLAARSRPLNFPGSFWKKMFGTPHYFPVVTVTNKCKLVY